MIKEHLLWVEKYRPHKIADAILPDDLKATFQQYVTSGEIPNLILAGTSGIGKTTVARALCDEIGLDYIIINASTVGGVDTMRTTVTNYAGAVSLAGGRKVVILDEADQLTSVVGGAQWALRGIIEEFASNCSFIFTCNHKNKLIPAIHSRCAVIDFRIPADFKQKMAVQLLKRVTDILGQESVEFDKAAVVQLITKYFPDFRRVLNELQRYSGAGKIDSGIFQSLGDVRVGEAVDYMKAKDFKALRKWVGVNSDQDAVKILRELYDKLADVLQPSHVPVAIVVIGDWMYKDAFVADHEIVLMSCLTQLMLECEFR